MNHGTSSGIPPDPRRIKQVMMGFNFRNRQRQESLAHQARPRKHVLRAWRTLEDRQLMSLGGEDS